MTTLVLKSGVFGDSWNMLDNFFPVPAFAEDITATSTTFIVHYDAIEYDKFTGSGFTYDFFGNPLSGTIASWVYVFAGVTEFSATGLNMPVDTFMSYYFADDWIGFLEAAFAGNDTITGSTSFDDLYGFDGNDVINGGNDWDIIFGGAGHDKLNGQAFIDELYGEAGNDTLDGGAGADTMLGGEGNDTYIVDDVGDVVDEEGNTDSGDTVKSSALIAGAFAGIENYFYTGAQAWSFTADGSDNVLSGGAAADNLDGAGGNDTLLGNGGNDILVGGIGDDLLDGGAGNDKMNGGSGNDTYVLNAAGDSITGEDIADTEDVVKSSVSVNLATLASGLIEHAFLTGATAINATGNAGDNELTGNAAANKLDGGAGADILTGGNGADIYTVDDIGDQVIETTAGTAGGIDLVNSSVSFALGTNVEKLTLIGSADIDGTGNTLNNAIIGNSGANILDGQAGNDTMTGGQGNDTYIVNSIGDIVTESVLNSAGGGVDTVESAITFSLATRANIENLTLTGVANINGTGNALANTILGNAGNNILNGGLDADVLKGGAGNDTYILDHVGDTVDEEANADTGDEVKSTALIGAFAGIENYTYTGTKAWNFTGTTADNKVSGSSVNDTLDGGQGNDWLLGNGGNDSLIGGEGDDILDGGAGNDKMTGGTGNDTYLVGALTDAIDEAGNADADDLIKSSISISLLSAAFLGVEHVELIGTAAKATGNADDNKLTGNAAANVLDGGAGADTMTGADGADTYIVDNLHDMVVETTGGAAGGIDLVMSSVDHTLSANVEKLTLTGIADIDAIGNNLNNTLIGNNGANILDGGAGSDTMTGGKGNDTYVVNSLGDVVNETILNGNGGGVDTVESAITFSLVTRTNIENLMLTGAGNINGTGNALNNLIAGNDGNNILSGNAGNDTLDGSGGDDKMTGGAGNDFHNGGSGNDTAVFAGAASGYLVTTDGGVVTVQDLNALVGGNDGIDTLIGVEFLKFSDQLVAVHLEPASQLDLSTLDGTNGFRLDGATAGDRAGASVAVIGDFNGDGLDDLLVGAIAADFGGTDAGSAYVVFGKASGLPSTIDLSTLDGTSGFRLDGEAAGDAAAWSVSSAGDVNGDGLEDLIVGAAWADPGYSGAAYVMFGTNAGLASTIDLSTLDGTNGFRLAGPDEQIGRDVSAAGDINGDGYDDVIVRGADGYVIFGHAGGFASDIDLTSLDGTNGVRLVRAYAALEGLSSAGDINGDGFDDLIVGATDHVAGLGSGAAYVVFGHGGDFTATIDLATLNGTNGFRLDGVSKQDSAGWDVSAAGDVNGDGYDDLLIAAPWAGSDDATLGAAYVVFGQASGFASTFDLATLDGANGFRIDGTGGALALVSSAGDINGDGYDDVIVSEPFADSGGNDSGAAYVVFGHEGGFDPTLDLSTLDGTDGFRLDAVSGDRAGAVSGAGDINGDGYDDLVVGADGANPSGEDSGSAYVIYGGDFTFESPHLGTAGADSLIGTFGSDLLVGAQGNDTLKGNGGADVFQAGDGDDRIEVTSLAFVHADGGGGSDTLALLASGSIDFGNLDGNGATSDRGTISGIETIDVTNGTANALTLGLADLLDLDVTNTDVGGVASLDNCLTILGDNADTLALSTADGWGAVDLGTLPGFAVYTSGGVQIAVDADITVTVT